MEEECVAHEKCAWWENEQELVEVYEVSTMNF